MFIYSVITTLQCFINLGTSTLSTHKDIVFFAQVSDKGIKYLGKYCKKLQELFVASCFGVTDDGVRAVLKGCSELEELDISRCYSVSDDSLRCATIYPNKLSLIRLTGCLKVCVIISDLIVYMCQFMVCTLYVKGYIDN